MTTRKCAGCSEIKPLEEFRKNHSKALGHDYRCIPCVRAYWRKYRDEHKEAVRQYARNTIERHPERLAARVAKYGQRPEAIIKKRIRQRARDAIKRGQLVKQPCETCGEAKVQAHHPDYSKPFDVRWLCLTHHKLIHRKYSVLEAASQELPDNT